MITLKISYLSPFLFCASSFCFEHNCLWLTIPDTFACEVVAPSELPHNIWPAPLDSDYATEKANNSFTNSKTSKPVDTNARVKTK